MAKDFRRADDASRYELHLDGALVGVLDYREAPGSVSLVRSFTTPPFRGRGLAGELVSFAVDDIEAAGGRSVVPMCWYVGQWFEQHPEKAHLLAPS
ncbi:MULTISPECIES: GNAT family N-acetyltransferase [unclassified Rathayibacter]|jgi:predicted GNAT family acetyltransferase|uniref:GNAT family N-acetyltransferase n=1 Tax=unclassified Rathayibacter TaxID=2609250 RepID=UPI000CE90088|nr:MULTISPECIES: GNAT family N-acetyltransferase [unclassified Rathayibacter]PPF11798.1 GNAT family N-acetyltransferase [Rathayibacter sp. AY1A5]PPF17413.1 GNAT family N-acetyltransferase [Rathayibacter sp. AY1A4]PPF19299.1 GNAT family N-acetyltransferase [Rathayibacter sp. AY1A7]PPF35810.1 GNAT family N-acetyltransferase [Rathayibacter sp. AY1A2]PPF35923.1 GNAT family N-acetyltransferase [Rathayibacter sp. AY1A3]